MTGPTAVYLLCLATSLVCAALLARAWRRSRSRLLLWTALAFGLLAVNNLFLVGDMIIFHEIDLRWARHGSALIAISILLYGFIWEAER